MVAGPSHRQVATLGGNICLDTRCVYYNQSHWWRKANGFCLKYQGEVCHVAPSGNRCRAAFSGDLAPALMVHDAEVEIAGPTGRRRQALAEFYQEDGAAHLLLEPGEIVVAVHLPASGRVSDYEKDPGAQGCRFSVGGCRGGQRPKSEEPAIVGSRDRHQLETVYGRSRRLSAGIQGGRRIFLSAGKTGTKGSLTATDNHDCAALPASFGCCAGRTVGQEAVMSSDVPGKHWLADGRLHIDTRGLGPPDPMVAIVWHISQPGQDGACHRLF